MRTIRNLAVAIIITVSFITQGCNESQKASPSPQATAKGQKAVVMNYDLKERDAFTVMGTQTRISASEMQNPDTYTKIWEGFEQYQLMLRPLAIEQRFFGVTFPTNKKDAFDYLAGVSVHSDAKSPDSKLIARNIPAARYAVFKCSMDDMGKTYQYIYGEWFASSRYTIDKNGCCFEQYAPKEWANRPVYIYIPIVPK